MLDPLAPVESAPFWYATHSEPSPRVTESGDFAETDAPVAKIEEVITSALACIANIANTAVARKSLV